MAPRGGDDGDETFLETFLRRFRRRDHDAFSKRRHLLRRASFPLPRTLHLHLAQRFSVSSLACLLVRLPPRAFRLKRLGGVHGELFGVRVIRLGGGDSFLERLRASTLDAHRLRRLLRL